MMAFDKKPGISCLVGPKHDRRSNLRDQKRQCPGIKGHSTYSHLLCCVLCRWESAQLLIKQPLPQAILSLSWDLGAGLRRPLCPSLSPQTQDEGRGISPIFPSLPTLPLNVCDFLIF